MHCAQYNILLLFFHVLSLNLLHLGLNCTRTLVLYWHRSWLLGMLKVDLSSTSNISLQVHVCMQLWHLVNILSLRFFS